MRTYYIVKHHTKDTRRPKWKAHRRGILSTMGIYNDANYVIGTLSYQSADECEQYLRNCLSPIKPEVVRVVRL